MEIPLEITYREAAKNDALEDLIRAKTPRLEENQEDIVSCRISVERVQGHQRSGSPYRIRIVMCIPPDKELVVSPKPGAEEANEQLKTTVNRAFEAMRRQVVRQKEKQLGEVKTHADAAVPGHVVRLNPGENFGFLRSLEGREIDFHRNSVVHDDFERLDIVTGGRHAPREGSQGPRAGTVQIVDKPGARASKVSQSGRTCPKAGSRDLCSRGPEAGEHEMEMNGRSHPWPPSN